MITKELADTRLASINTIEGLRNLLNDIDISSSGSTTVLYSGYVNGTHSTNIINEIKKDPNIRVIDNTEASKFLYKNDHLNDALERIFGDIPTDIGSQSNQFLYGEMVNGVRQPNGAWDIISKRFVKEASGDVRVLMDMNADPTRVFGATELKALLDNSKVTSIEGIPKSELISLKDSDGISAVFERVRDQAWVNAKSSDLSINQTEGWLNINDETRNEPESIARVVEASKELTPEQLQRLGRYIPFFPNQQLDENGIENVSEADTVSAELAGIDEQKQQAQPIESPVNEDTEDANIAGVAAEQLNDSPVEANTTEPELQAQPVESPVNENAEDANIAGVAAEQLNDSPVEANTTEPELQAQPVESPVNENAGDANIAGVAAEQLNDSPVEANTTEPELQAQQADSQSENVAIKDEAKTLESDNDFSQSSDFNPSGDNQNTSAESGVTPKLRLKSFTQYCKERLAAQSNLSSLSENDETNAQNVTDEKTDNDAIESVDLQSENGDLDKAESKISSQNLTMKSSEEYLKGRATETSKQPAQPELAQNSSSNDTDHSL